MTAQRDKTRSTYFVITPHHLNVCAPPGPVDSASFADAYPTRKSWTVCSHLSSPEKALAYHRENKPVLIVHGFVLCQECNNRNILTGQDGFNTMLRFSTPQDDSFFQQFIMGQEMWEECRSWTTLHTGTEEEAEKRRLVCPHLDTEQKRHFHYASKKILFWHQDILSCDQCIEDVKNGEKASIEGNGLMLHERSFSELVVAPLCNINREYFGLQG